MIARMAHGWVDGHTHAHIAISRAVYDSMIARGESTPNDVTVVANGITLPDRATFAPPSQIREQLGVSHDAILIVCACRLEPEKDVMTLIEAMPLLPASPTVKLAIVGSGSLEPELQSKIRDWQLSDCTSLLGFREDVLSIIAAADIFVLPSKAEPFGLAILEAMSLGKPVIATAAGGPLEIVVNDTTGLLVPPNNPAALAEAIQALIVDPTIRAAMGRKGLERFRECFTADRMSDETVNVYHRVLGVGADERGVPANSGDAATVH
jgi:glycosyltransferase involved in cell wall biosynthesis